MSKEGKYDLEERTAKFGESVIEFCKDIKINEISKSLVNQLIRSATSVGANYNEADCAESNNDFIHKMSIAKKESKESKHWLRMIAKACPELVGGARVLWREATELNLIFSSIIRKSRSKLDN